MRAARIWVVCALLGCGSDAPAPKQPASPPEPAPAEAESPLQQLVTSFVIIDACPDSHRINSKQANKEIDELVGPCKKVPGGAAHFSATLQPNGSVELASPEGNPDDGVVPTCVLQQQKQLRHKLRLTKACKFDVKLEQRVAGAP
jgi:hypothetical protein